MNSSLQHVGPSSLTRGQNPGPLHWEHGVLAAGSRGVPRTRLANQLLDDTSCPQASLAVSLVDPSLFNNEHGLRRLDGQKQTHLEDTQHLCQLVPHVWTPDSPPPWSFSFWFTDATSQPSCGHPRCTATCCKLRP